MKGIHVEEELNPVFAAGSSAKLSVVRLAPWAYVRLLVKANITNPALWPPGMQKGARALERVRAIERRCKARHGKFDWEELSQKLQDEYDSLCALLDELQDSREVIPFATVQAELARRRK